MTCRDVTSFLPNYLHGALDTEDTAEIEQHTAACDNCREFVREYRLTIAASQAAFRSVDAGAPSAVPDDLVRDVGTDLGAST